MGRFDNKWSEEHRVAITGAVLDDGFKVTEVLRRAQAGNLLELEPFDMPYSTARTYISRERHRRDASQLATLTAEEANAGTHALVRRMYDYADREMARLERARKPDFTGFERLVVAVGKLQKVASELPGERRREGGEPDPRGGAIQRYTPQVEAMMEAARQQQLGQPGTSHAEPLAEEPEVAEDDSQRAEKDCLPHARGGDEASAGQHERRQEIRAELEAAAQTEGEPVSVVGGNQRPIRPTRYQRSRIARPSSPLHQHREPRPGHQ